MEEMWNKMKNIKLQYIDNHFDGVPVWSEIEIKGFVAAEYDKLVGDDGNELVSSIKFIIPPICPLPKPGNRICCDGKTYDVLLVEIKRSMTGRVAGYNCVCGDI